MDLLAEDQDIGSTGTSAKDQVDDVPRSHNEMMITMMMMYAYPPTLTNECIHRHTRVRTIRREHSGWSDVTTATMTYACMHARTNSHAHACMHVRCMRDGLLFEQTMMRVKVKMQDGDSAKARKARRSSLSFYRYFEFHARDLDGLSKKGGDLTDTSIDAAMNLFVNRLPMWVDDDVSPSQSNTHIASSLFLVKFGNEVNHEGRRGRRKSIIGSGDMVAEYLFGREGDQKIVNAVHCLHQAFTKCATWLPSSGTLDNVRWIIFPAHVNGNHWKLYVVDNDQRPGSDCRTSIMSFDSLDDGPSGCVEEDGDGGQPDPHCNRIRNYLAIRYAMSEQRDKDKIDMTALVRDCVNCPFTRSLMPLYRVPIPQQRNTHDCGLYMLKSAERFLALPINCDASNDGDTASAHRWFWGRTTGTPTMVIQSYRMTLLELFKRNATFLHPRYSTTAKESRRRSSRISTEPVRCGMVTESNDGEINSNGDGSDSASEWEPENKADDEDDDDDDIECDDDDVLDDEIDCIQETIDSKGHEGGNAMKMDQAKATQARTKKEGRLRDAVTAAFNLHPRGKSERSKAQRVRRELDAALDSCGTRPSHRDVCSTRTTEDGDAPAVVTPHVDDRAERQLVPASRTPSLAVGTKVVLSGLSPMKPMKPGNKHGGTRETEEWRKTKIGPEAILAALEKYKCKAACNLGCEQRLNVRLIKNCRMKLYAKGIKRTERMPFIFNQMLKNTTSRHNDDLDQGSDNDHPDWSDDASSPSPGDGDIVIGYNVDGHDMCERAFKLAYDPTPRAYCDVKRRILAGHKHPRRSRGDGIVAVPTKETKESHVLSWAKTYSKELGMYMPDSTDRDRIMLYDTKVSQLHAKYKEDNAGDDEKNMSLMHFSRSWKKFAAQHQVKLRRPNSNFATCELCAKYQADLSMNIERAQRDETRAHWAQHMKIQRECRVKYWHHRRKSSRSQSTRGRWEKGEKTHLSIILDKMSHWKTSLPRTAEHSKAREFEDKAKLFGQHVMGCIIHGVETIAFVLNPFVGSSGPSIVIECLVRALLRVPAPLPDVLYLQLDNCWGDNKNAWMLAFAHYLVEARVFEKVVINFLVVGHTHEDIDAKFGELSREMAGKKIASLSSMKEMLETVFDHVENVNAKGEYKEWFGGVDEKGIHTKKKHFHSDPLKYITIPHMFRFKLQKNGTVGMHYRKYMISKNWFPGKLVRTAAFGAAAASAVVSRRKVKAANVASAHPFDAVVKERIKPNQLKVGDVVLILTAGGDEVMGLVLDVDWTGHITPGRDCIVANAELHPSNRVRMSGFDIGASHVKLSKICRATCFGRKWWASGRRVLFSWPRLEHCDVWKVNGVDVGDSIHSGCDDEWLTDDDQSAIEHLWDEDDDDERVPLSKLEDDSEDEDGFVCVWSNKSIETERAQLNRVCATCPRVPNHKCTHATAPGDGRPRCAKCCEHPHCKVHAESHAKRAESGEDSQRDGRKKKGKGSSSTGKHVVGQGHCVLKSIPKTMPKLAKWAVWDDYWDMKTHILRKCLSHALVRATAQEIEEWKAKFNWYESHREAMESGHGTLPIADVLALPDRSRQAWERDDGKTPGRIPSVAPRFKVEPIEFEHEQVTGGGLSAALVKENMKRKTMEKLSKLKVDVSVGDMVGVHMEPDPVNCPEHPLPVRIGEVNQCEDDRVKVTYYYPVDKMYDGPYRIWVPNVKGKKQPRYIEWVPRQSLCCNLGPRKSAFVGKRKKRLSDDARRVLASISFADYAMFVDLTSRSNKRLLVGQATASSKKQRVIKLAGRKSGRSDAIHEENARAEAKGKGDSETKTDDGNIDDDVMGSPPSSSSDNSDSDLLVLKRRPTKKVSEHEDAHESDEKQSSDSTELLVPKRRTRKRRVVRKASTLRATRRQKRKK